MLSRCSTRLRIVYIVLTDAQAGGEVWEGGDDPRLPEGQRRHSGAARRGEKLMLSILFYFIIVYFILSYPILSYPILSYPILSYPILS